MRYLIVLSLLCIIGCGARSVSQAAEKDYDDDAGLLACMKAWNDTKPSKPDLETVLSVKIIAAISPGRRADLCQGQGPFKTPSFKQTGHGVQYDDLPGPINLKGVRNAIKELHLVIGLSWRQIEGSFIGLRDGKLTGAIKSPFSVDELKTFEEQAAKATPNGNAALVPHEKSESEHLIKK